MVRERLGDLPSACPFTAVVGVKAPRGITFQLGCGSSVSSRRDTSFVPPYFYFSVFPFFSRSHRFSPQNEAPYGSGGATQIVMSTTAAAAAAAIYISFGAVVVNSTVAGTHMATYSKAPKGVPATVGG